MIKLAVAFHMAAPDALPSAPIAIGGTAADCSK